MKRKFSLTLDEKLIEKAHDLGLNIIRTCEKALIHRIHALQQLENPKQPFLSLGSFAKEVECGRRDLNPGRQRGRLMS